MQDALRCSLDSVTVYCVSGHARLRRQLERMVIALRYKITDERVAAALGPPD
ncbi:hypothetical protein [Nocardia wallacei]|uniref:hypothetical protein n=1 Tax=Nocardia wallacei TaxID=480035 RepID=UPI002456AA51|nr:hypothetical protein [Nocardia wallacei]